jgi:integrase
MARLTTKDCERLLAAGVPEGRTVVKHSDGGGLYLVQRVGRDTASWLYHSRSGDHNLGSFPDVVPKAARDALVTYRAGLLATAAETPRSVPRAAGGKSFTAVVAEWLKGREWKPTTKDDATAALGRLSFAAKPINTITREDVVADIKALQARLIAAGESGRSAQDVRQWLKRIFDFAEIEPNPADFTGKYKEQIPDAPKKGKNHHAAVEWEKLPAVYKALPATEAARALRFLILTAVRSGDVEQARWSQIQGENGTSVWVIPETKSGAELRVPLSPAALALLGDRGEPDALIFSLKSNQMLNTLQVAVPDVVVHGLRATFKTWCGDNGHSREEAELSLAHKLGNAVEQAYNRTDLLKRRRKLMETWVDFVTRAAA